MPQKNPYEVRDREALQRCVDGSQRVIPHSVRSLAELVGVSRGTIGHLLSGARTRVSVPVAERLAEVLGEPVEALFVPTASTSSDSDDEA